VAIEPWVRVDIGHLQALLCYQYVDPGNVL
jgi:hypothetical protein